MSNIKAYTENNHVMLMLESDEGQAAHVAMTKQAAFELVESLVLACRDTRDAKESAFHMQSWGAISTTKH